MARVKQSQTEGDKNENQGILLELKLLVFD